MYEVLELLYADKGMEIGKSDEVAFTIGIADSQVNIPPADEEASFYVGDAAGRAGDHSDTDRKWAVNAKLKFMVPEEHFR